MCCTYLTSRYNDDCSTVKKNQMHHVQLLCALMYMGVFAFTHLHNSFLTNSRVLIELSRKIIRLDVIPIPRILNTAPSDKSLTAIP
jgi:hypothetical protein